MRRILSLILVLSLLLSSLPLSYAATDTTDKSYDVWAEEFILEADSNQLLPLDLASKYKTSITRKEFATLAVYLLEKLKGEKIPLPTYNPFIDTNDGFVMKAYSYGIIKGTSYNTFSPDAKVTREEICTMLINMLSNLEIDKGISLLEPADIITFADESSISSWAKVNVKQAFKNGIMTGIGGNKVAPKGNATRQEAIALSVKTYRSMLKILSDTSTTEERASFELLPDVTYNADTSDIIEDIIQYEGYMIVKTNGVHSVLENNIGKKVYIYTNENFTSDIAGIVDKIDSTTYKVSALPLDEIFLELDLNVSDELDFTDMSILDLPVISTDLVYNGELDLLTPKYLSTSSSFLSDSTSSGQSKKKGLLPTVGVTENSFSGSIELPLADYFGFKDTKDKGDSNVTVEFELSDFILDIKSNTQYLPDSGATTRADYYKNKKKNPAYDNLRFGFYLKGDAKVNVTGTLGWFYDEDSKISEAIPLKDLSTVFKEKGIKLTKELKIPIKAISFPKNLSNSDGKKSKVDVLLGLYLYISAKGEISTSFEFENNGKFALGSAKTTKGKKLDSSFSKYPGLKLDKTTLSEDKYTLNSNIVTSKDLTITGGVGGTLDLGIILGGACEIGNSVDLEAGLKGYVSLSGKVDALKIGKVFETVEKDGALYSDFGKEDKKYRTLFLTRKEESNTFADSMNIDINVQAKLVGFADFKWGIFSASGELVLLKTPAWNPPIKLLKAVGWEYGYDLSKVMNKPTSEVISYLDKVLGNYDSGTWEVKDGYLSRRRVPIVFKVESGKVVGVLSSNTLTSVKLNGTEIEKINSMKTASHIQQSTSELQPYGYRLNNSITYETINGIKYKISGFKLSGEDNFSYVSVMPAYTTKAPSVPEYKYSKLNKIPNNLRLLTSNSKVNLLADNNSLYLSYADLSSSTVNSESVLKRFNDNSFMLKFKYNFKSKIEYAGFYNKEYLKDGKKHTSICIYVLLNDGTFMVSSDDLGLSNYSYSYINILGEVHFNIKSTSTQSVVSKIINTNFEIPADYNGTKLNNVTSVYNVYGDLLFESFTGEYYVQNDAINSTDNYNKINNKSFRKIELLDNPILKKGHYVYDIDTKTDTTLAGSKIISIINGAVFVQYKNYIVSLDNFAIPDNNSKGVIIESLPDIVSNVGLIKIKSDGYYLATQDYNTRIYSYTKKIEGVVLPSNIKSISYINEENNNLSDIIQIETQNGQIYLYNDSVYNGLFSGNKTITSEEKNRNLNIDISNPNILDATLKNIRRVSVTGTSIFKDNIIYIFDIDSSNTDMFKYKIPPLYELSN